VSRFSIGCRTEDEVMNRTESPSFICGTRLQSRLTGPPKKLEEERDKSLMDRFKP
jgi:hypothetical protein